MCAAAAPIDAIEAAEAHERLSGSAAGSKGLDPVFVAGVPQAQPSTVAKSIVLKPPKWLMEREDAITATERVGFARGVCLAARVPTDAVASALPIGRDQGATRVQTEFLRVFFHSFEQAALIIRHMPPAGYTIEWWSRLQDRAVRRDGVRVCRTDIYARAGARAAGDARTASPQRAARILRAARQKAYGRGQ